MANTPSSSAIRSDGDDVLIDVKVVPGASRSRVMGLLGDRIKVAISAAPEKGRANAELVKLIATGCGVQTRSVTVERGSTSPQKTLRVRSVSPDAVRVALLG